MTRASVRLPREIRNGCLSGQISSRALIDRRLFGTKGNEGDHASKSKASSQLSATAKEERDIKEILSLTLNLIVSSPSSRAGAHRIMKLKNLKKKIQRLEKRLQEGPKKLAKLKQKLQTAEAAKAAKARKKSAARAAAKPSKPIEAKKSVAGKKMKKKLNLSPERRAQLAAAMKARWAAKRAAEANAKAASGDNQHSAPPGATPQPPENRPNGV